MDFINSHADWEARIASAPYSVRVKRDGRYALLKYSQAESDFSLPIVRECRGIILDMDGGAAPVCVPFFKFGNYGEPYVPEIDWGSARVQEKIDGSIMKLWHHRGEWHLSSNSEIDAGNARVRHALLPGKEETTLAELFWEAWGLAGADIGSLDTGFTYMFELASPFNRVVVRYGDVRIWHIGTRDMGTLEERDMDIGIARPKEYAFGTLGEVINAAGMIGPAQESPHCPPPQNGQAPGAKHEAQGAMGQVDREGFVVVDKNFNRVKVKSPQYVRLSHLVAGVTTKKNIVGLIKSGQRDEFLNYFPEYAGAFANISDGIERFLAEVERDGADIAGRDCPDRKSLAEAILAKRCPPYHFAKADGKADSPRGWLMQRSPEQIMRWIGEGEEREASL